MAELFATRFSRRGRMRPRLSLMDLGRSMRGRRPRRSEQPFARRAPMGVVTPSVDALIVAYRLAGRRPREVEDLRMLFVMDVRTVLLSLFCRRVLAS